MASSFEQRGGGVWSGLAETIPGINSADDLITAASTAQSAGGK